MVTFATVSERVPFISKVPSGSSITAPDFAAISAAWRSFSKFGPAAITPSFAQDEIANISASAAPRRTIVSLDIENLPLLNLQISRAIDRFAGPIDGSKLQLVR